MKELLRKIISDALKKLNVEFDDNDIVIEIPKDTKNGDYSTNIAMKLARELKKNPKEIAEFLKEEIKESFIKDIDLAGPGFINFFVTEDYLYENINYAIKSKDEYGVSNFGNGKKINVEYVSANPTGILHLGHARGASYGDSLSRILKYVGYNVTREYYINDAGNQISNLQASVFARYEEICGRQFVLPVDGYHGSEIIKIAEEIKNKYGESVEDQELFKKFGLDYLLEKIKQDLKNFRVEFDVWSSEQALYDSGAVKKAYNTLVEKGYTYNEDGAVFLKTSEYGDEKDRVLIKKDKTNTYLLPDIAYHTNKYERGYDEYIDVLGADHHGYIPRLKASIYMMGYDPNKLSAEILQMVRLVRGKEEIKMSKRTGNAVTIEELVNEVGLDATRYLFSSRSLDTQLDFDLELATKQSNENPVYYTLYAYARICSILNSIDIKYELPKTYTTLNTEHTKNLMKKVYEFKDTVITSAKKRSPHIIANYAYDLAGLFHTFYANEKVLSDDKISQIERLCLIEAVKNTIKNSLLLIGVNTREKM